MRELAERNDANRGFLLLIAAVVTGVIMIAVGSELARKGGPQQQDVILVIGTLCLSWLFSTLVYALHTPTSSTRAAPRVETAVASAFLERRRQITGTSHTSRHASP